MSAIIYVEGGARGPDSKNLRIRCQEAFHRLLQRMGFSGRMPRLKACGGRDAVFDDFQTAHQSGGQNYIAMWIDSEEPMSDGEAAWEHLAGVTTVQAWERPDGAEDEQVLFMVTCMESWIVADRETLKAHFGSKLQESALPPLVDLESRERDDVQSKLMHATRNCSNAYRKGERSFEILGKLEPAALEPHLPAFVRVRRILNEQL